MTTDLDLSDLRNAKEVLARTETGTAVAELADRLGLVNAATLNTTHTRRQFTTDVSKLSPPKLSDEQSYWASEFGRIVELIGLLAGQEQFLALQAKAARSRARARILRELPADEKRPTSTALSDMAEDDAAVVDADYRLSLVRLMLEAARASEKATAMYLTTLSREISFRCTQMEARVY